ncbi:MAG: SHOCT domain-containing protein [Bacteroidales bacterium]|jgi:hypothetical protein
MDTIEEIKKLKALLDQGAITAEEFNDLKKKTINDKLLIPTAESKSTDNSLSASKRRPSWLRKILLTSGLAIITILVLLGIKYKEPIRQKIVGGKKTQNIENKDIIYENGEKLGVLITKRFTQTHTNNGLTLSVPAGKIWTPLYFEVKVNVGESYNYSIPYIYPDKYATGGWFIDTKYSFPIKADFVSYKYSKRNNKALAGDFAVLCDRVYTDKLNASIVLYFLEE